MGLSLSDFHRVVTKDYLGSIGGSDLFSNGLVGKSYIIEGVKPLDKTKTDSPLLIEVNDGVRTMSWFLNNFLKNVILEDGDGLLDVVRSGKVPASFKIVGFEAGHDYYGAPLYSMRVFDLSVVRKVLPEEYQTIIDKDAEFSERGIANSAVRDRAQEFFLKRYTNADGTLTQEASDQFRLGVLKVKVTGWLA